MLPHLKVYVVDERHLYIKNFRFEKTGPSAYFWVGNDKQPSPRGRIVPYPQNPGDIDLMEIMNSIEAEQRQKAGGRGQHQSTTERNRWRQQGGGHQQGAGGGGIGMREGRVRT